MQKMLIGALAAALLPALPAAAQSRAERQMMADIRMLQEQSQQLAVSLAALSETLGALNKRLDAQDEAARKGFADQRLLIDNIGADLRVIRERSSETNVRINTLSQEMEALRASVTAIAAAAAAQTAAATPVDPTAPVDPNAPPAVPAPVLPPTVGLSPTRMYETAWTDYVGGQWSLAITGFEAFLKTFPNSELADEAQFYIGETFFSQGRFQEAVAAYNRVIERYPGTNSIPDAYYKRGLAQDRLGQPDAARESWEFVIKTYPETDASRMAKQNLDRLGTRKPGAQ